MKHYLPFLSSLFAIMILIVSCTPASQKAEPATVGQSPVHSDTCSVDSISKTVFLQERSAWLTKRAALVQLLVANRMAADTVYLAKSFRLHKCDLTGVINALTDTTTTDGSKDSIWATLAIRNTNQVTLIMHAQDKKTKKDVYYDFSRPCPPGTCE